jgi:FAD/FMN-containing dehydrogenase
MTKTQIPEILITADDPRFDDARRAWNLAVDQRPAAVAQPRSAEELAAAVTHATAAGLRVAVQGTGHGAASLDSLEATVLVKTSAMRGVTIAPAAMLARVEAGALWGDVVAPAAEHGLAALAGSSHDVGVVGYCLGGGLSWLARKHGLAANSVVAVQIVTADGRVVVADANHEADLFWAVRGGGGNFGVAASFEFRLHPVGPIVTGGLVAFPFAEAREAFAYFFAGDVYALVSVDAPFFGSYFASYVRAIQSITGVGPIPVSTARKRDRSVITMLIPRHSLSLNTEERGVNRTGTKRTPGIRRLFRYDERLCASIQGAPTSSKGVSVPRPTETFVVSSSPIPGYKVASVRLRIFGDGFTQVRFVESNHIERRQPSILITRKSQPILRS